MFKISYHSDFSKYWKKIPKSQHKKITNKMQELKYRIDFRHMKQKSKFFVLEIGSFRVCFKQEKNTRILFFIGNHKDYEKWYKKDF